MTKKSKFLTSVLLFFATVILINIILAIFFMPHDQIAENRYFEFSFFNTIVSYFSETLIAYLPFALLSAGFCWLVYFGLSFIGKSGNRDLFQLRFFNNKIYPALSMLAVLLAAGILLLYPGGDSANRPNVILIAVDTLRADYTSVFSDQKKNTPYLEKFTDEDAVLFPNAYANSPWTLPSFASILTSQYPSRLNINRKDDTLEPEFFTIPEYLKEYGYKTCGIVSNIFLRTSFGFNQGYDIYNEDNISPHNKKLYGISSPGVTEDGIDFIRKNKDKRFFLFLHYFDPHYYYFDHDKTRSYDGLFKDAETKGDEGDLILNINMGRQKYHQEDIDWLSYCYQSEIRFTDKYIGMVIEELKKQGLYDNSIIIFTADHGEEFIERGALGHGHTLYDEIIKVPMAIKLPAGQKYPGGRVNKNWVSNVDILPTLLNLLKIREAEKTHGYDLFGEYKEDNTFYSEVNQNLYRKHRRKICAFQGKWKLILDLKTKKYELYNIENDPKELNDKFEEEDKSPSRILVKKMKREIAKFLAMRKQYSSHRSGKKAKLTDEEKRRLKSLGYF